VREGGREGINQISLVVVSVHEPVRHEGDLVTTEVVARTHLKEGKRREGGKEG